MTCDIPCEQIRNSEKIVEILTTSVWEKDKHPGEPPPLTNDDLKPHEPVQVIHDRAGGFKLDMIRKMPIPLVKRNFGVKTPIYGTPELDKELNEVRKEIDNLDATVEAIEEHHALLWKRYKTLLNARMFFTFGVFLIADFAERIEAIDQMSEAVWQVEVKMPHPLAPVVRACLIERTHRTIKTATVDHTNQLTTKPYIISEVTRRKWEPVGSVDAVEVDGEPIVTKMRQPPGRWVTDDEAWEAKAYKPKGTQGELMPMPRQRYKIETPIMLIAYQKWGDNLKASLASDVAILMSIAYAANEPLILPVKDGAKLLARGQDGKMRKPQPPDEHRFERAFSCVHGMAAWIEDKRGIPRFYPLTACDRFSDNRVSIAAASWARERKDGRWTLTAGFGVAAQNRLKGNAHNNNIWRVVTGVEYWLARDKFCAKGTHKGISQALTPKSGITGPGDWYDLTWKELMMIAGDVWDLNNKKENERSYQRFKKIRNALIQYGYQGKSLNTPAEAGDTVEFLFYGKSGKVKVRATARFVEGARKAKKNDWKTTGLGEFLGF